MVPGGRRELECGRKEEGGRKEGGGRKDGRKEGGIKGGRGRMGWAGKCYYISRSDATVQSEPRISA